MATAADSSYPGAHSAISEAAASVLARDGSAKAPVDPVKMMQQDLQLLLQAKRARTHQVAHFQEIVDGRSLSLRNLSGRDGAKMLQWRKSKMPCG